jgi:hypothetical protein
VAAGEAEAQNGQRSGPRRRRGRGGRGRRGGTTPYAPGAYPDSASPAAAPDEGDDLHEGDDDGDEFGHEEHDGPEPHSVEPHAAAPAPVEKAPEHSPAEPSSSEERAPFSFFGWMRRDEEKK